jgi:hypothetical protein
MTDVGDPYDDNDVDQVYAILSQPRDSFAVGVWFHARNSKTGVIEDDVAQYSVDPSTGADRIRKLNGSEALGWEREICTQSNILILPSAGQDSRVCRDILKKPASD